MHRRLGHCLTKSILLAKECKVFADVKVVPDLDDFCEACKISTTRSANKGREKDAEHIAHGGQILHLDVQSDLSQ